MTKYIQELIQKDKTLLSDKQKFTSPKAFLYQMYFVISRLDEHRLAKMDFMINFGVTMESIKIMQNLLENGGTYPEAKDTSFAKLPLLQVLKIFKYFSWADKKLHQVFFIENKDDISEDLLSDFKDPDSETKFKQPKTLAGTKDPMKQMLEEKPNKVIVQEATLVSEHDYIFGTKKVGASKIIDVKSKEDFPTLFEKPQTGEPTSTGPLWSTPGVKHKPGKKGQ